MGGAARSTARVLILLGILGHPVASFQEHHSDLWLRHVVHPVNQLRWREMFIGDLTLNFRETRQKNDVVEDHLLHRDFLPS